MLNSNVRRIQNSSSRFADMVFRVSTTWKSGIDRSILRTGKEYQTMDAIVSPSCSPFLEVVIEKPPQQKKTFFL